MIVTFCPVLNTRIAYIDVRPACLGYHPSTFFRLLKRSPAYADPRLLVPNAGLGAVEYSSLMQVLLTPDP